MKRIMQLFLPAALLLSAGCKKEMPGYEGTEGVYFAVQYGQASLSENYWPYQPTTPVSFVSYGSDEITYPVKVMITGPLKDFDRPFRVEVNPDSTTATLGVHYEALPEEVIMPANSLVAYVPVKLKRTADLQEKEVKLGLRLVANEYFGLSFPEWDAIPGYESGPLVKEFDASMHTLYVSDFMVQPVVWRGSIQNGNRESGLWGAFTRKKLELMAELMGVTYADFASEETMPLVKSMLLTNIVQEYLIERYNAKDPVLEDDGRLMWVGSVPWTSYIGVPYVPGG
ncbi:DUF4843 domain-containing protein [Chitinophaga cymbidii]|nr:DUF4843 domain-containing protein [Chitinophaga cymbidii]